MPPTWDRDLPNLALADFRINANSLTAAWTHVSTRHLVRSVLVTSNRPVEGISFVYESGSCTAHDFFDALAKTYELAWVQDEPTGITWFHPREVAYDRVLGEGVLVGRDQFGLPMQSGVLEPLASSGAAWISAKEWGTVFRNTFDYAVDIPAGTYTIRGILNQCCCANPTKTFFVQADPRGALVTAVNLVSDERGPVPPGALLWWDVEIGRDRGRAAPTARDVMAMLAHQDARLRAAARGYLEAIIWQAELDEWLDRATSVEEALWTSIGLLSVLVRTEEATHQASIKLFERLASDELLAECAPGLALITALEVLRLTKSSRALDVVRERKLHAQDLAGVTSDACRIAASSRYVRRALQAGTAEALLEMMTPLAALVRSPTGGRLELSLGHSP